MSYISTMVYMVITKCQPFRAHFHMPTKLVKGTRSQNWTYASHTQHPHSPHIHMEKVEFEEGVDNHFVPKVEIDFDLSQIKLVCRSCLVGLEIVVL